MNELKLTPEAEAILWDNYMLHNSSTNFRLIKHILNDTKLLKAQGLYTREEVKDMIKNAYINVNSSSKTPDDYVESILPQPPKTEP